MILLAGFYLDPDPARQGELLECVRRNAANACISEIHLLVEEPVDITWLIASHAALDTPKVRLVAHGRRATYRDFFAYANQRLPRGTAIVANADIFFDHTLRRLEDVDLANRMLCLSRWDVLPDGTARFFDFAASQDAWIFETPIRSFACDIPLGVPGCDNRLAWEAQQAGLVVSNPSRSIRAYHLHLSGVRRYHERQRVTGPTQSVAATVLGGKWLWFVVPCRDRLGDLRRTIATLASQPRSSIVVVDYSSTDGTGAWVRATYPQASLVTIAGRGSFHGAHARNQGAAAADGDAILCFLDADVAVAPDFSELLLARVEPGTFLVPDGAGPGLDTAVVCGKQDFDRCGGYDEALLHWGEEGGDLRDTLRAAGLAERRFPAHVLSHLGSGAHEALPAREATMAIHGAYRRAKAALRAETGGRAISQASRSEIYRAIARHRLAETGADPPAAAIAFREEMGYTVETLEAGASSHNNDPRPFADIPEKLAGHQFTQVVSSRVSPVEVEFLSAGKLYVLVGTDWSGYHPAREWLKAQGRQEPLPPVETRRGTAFEVWSILGEEGDRYVLPTQVMLVSNHLVRR